MLQTKYEGSHFVSYHTIDAQLSQFTSGSHYLFDVSILWVIVLDGECQVDITDGIQYKDNNASKARCVKTTIASPNLI